MKNKGFYYLFFVRCYIFFLISVYYGLKYLVEVKKKIINKENECLVMK